MAREPDDPLRDAFDSRRRAPRVTRWTLFVLLFSVPAGLIAGVNGGGKWELFAIIVGPVLVLLLLQSFVQPSDAEQTRQGTGDRGLLESVAIAQGVVAKQFAVAMGALLIAVATAIGATWIGAAWICLPLGITTSVLLWRHRGRSGFLAALAFTGIPLAVYGLGVGGLLLFVQR